MPMAPRRLQQAQLQGHSAILADLRSQKPQRLPVFSAQVRALGALHAFARMEKDGKTKPRPDSDVLLRSLLCMRQGGWMHSDVVNELVYLFNKRQR
ncbi:TPA: hypothetical protein ACH3X1_010159 [Trebouxia sp. C0004]